MPSQSTFESLDIPETDLFNFLYNRNDREFPRNKGIVPLLKAIHSLSSPVKVVFRDAESGKTRTWEQVFSTAIDFGRGLSMRFGIGVGDVVLLVAENSIDYASLVLGVLWSGATVSTANPNYTSIELEHQLRDTAAKVVLAKPQAAVKMACQRLGVSTDRIIQVGDGAPTQLTPNRWDDIAAEGRESSCMKPKVCPKDDIAFLVYSSGTTGLPKGVRLSHYNVVASTLQVRAAEGGNLTWNGSKTSPGIPLPSSTEGDIVLTCLPFFHIYGLSHMVLAPLYSGFQNLVMSSFEITRWCQLVQRHSVSYSYIVPPIALLLANHPAPATYNLRSLRMVNSGAAPLPPDLITKVYRRTGIRVKQSYGLSEASPCVFAPRWEDWESAAGSAGKLLPNLEIRFCYVRDDDSHHDEVMEVAQGDPGELQLKGPNIFLGYHNRHQESIEAFTKDGWFRTGDVGYLDRHGNLYITDRAKEMIKYKGFQIAPAELESLLRQNPLIADVAVVGVDAIEKGTELPRAYVVRQANISNKNGATLDKEQEQEIIHWLSSQVVKYKRLSGGVRFVQQIPRSPTGKILRRVLKEQARSELKSSISQDSHL
ncbi:hypothetical protein PV10_07484 [Exophiala mesophila]|uniref:Uncharacterized protein n=1 Tax=Exophiala mesophila TaxID=212818 RepID=A0A0D1Z810_EXOME|nr:uncharacterized protein PV10_07484 [Exophiala mesophila]KIV90144.1 hypothetical protein PV10_07484 [Exophiala mesophila]